MLICVTNPHFAINNDRFTTNFDTWRKRKLGKIMFAAKFSATTNKRHTMLLMMHLLRFKVNYSIAKIIFHETSYNMIGDSTLFCKFPFGFLKKHLFTLDSY